ncbi:hypothetical protein ASPFODRAFT_39152 [Aspergillus luchuensis CBS 106.47]|uniref:Uncharacterized protein n=1 Tax=Aspergillus luchuensis (strain CBS 106.47) TaxID=1137211 RepID=A0A1M3TYU0_ASPLC|nr:hypothetical protein ASPFODRAFT_39152 [Aspergillus luchuensis CBS 106.47]
MVPTPSFLSPSHPLSLLPLFFIQSLWFFFFSSLHFFYLTGCFQSFRPFRSASLNLPPPNQRDRKWFFTKEAWTV